MSKNKIKYKKQRIKYSDLRDAYYDCRRTKHRTVACAQFEIREMENIASLYRDIKTGVYQIGASDAFVVTRPKYREIFAADFRDRIVHHYLMNRTLRLFEDHFIDDTYNCRVGKGVLYGVQRIQSKIMSTNGGDCWVLKCDLKNFFMSINKDILCEKLLNFLQQKYHEKDKETILWLTEMVVKHQPELKCVLKGNLTLWGNLPTGKSLFSSEPNKGMAIGNLTRQIYGNFYLADFDKFVLSHGVKYGRYVDDFICISTDKAKLLKLLPKIRKFLKENLDLELNEKKVSLQHASKGVSFVGYVINRNCIFPGNRLKGNVVNLIREINALPTKTIKKKIEAIAQRYNSYMGFLIHTRSYKFRKELYEMLDDRIKSMTTIRHDYSCLRVRNKYKKKTKSNAKINNAYKKLQAYRRGASGALLPKCPTQSEWGLY